MGVNVLIINELQGRIIINYFGTVIVRGGNW